MRNTMSNVGNLQEEALKRKERLQALKRLRESDSISSANESTTESDSLPKPIFRSYKPQDESLKELVIPKAKPGDVEEKIKDQLEAGTPKPVIEEVDLVNLAPRKPDWDLKRDIASKLRKLEKRTQKAIAELIRERMKQGKEDLIVDAINAATAANQNQADSDED